MPDPGAEKTLYLVDGTSQLFRAYYAIRGLTNAEGLPTNAAYGFTTMLRKLIKDESPEYLAVAFDLPGPTFRHDRYEEYKAHREKTPDDLNVQVPYAKEVCRAFRVPVLELAGFEADDLIGTFTRLATEAGFRVTVVASDKDLLQLVDERVLVLNPAKNIRLDAPGVEDAFGVPPERVRDVLGLMGDSVDNIPGVPGVGEKTALAMVATYGDLTAILARAERFTDVWSARDALLSAVSDKEPADHIAGTARDLAGRIDALVVLESDEPFRERLLGARSALDATDVADSRALRSLVKTLRALDRGSQKRQWLAVHEHREQARLSRELATVERNAPIAFAADDLAVGAPDRARLHELFSELGFESLLEEMGGGGGGAAPPASPFVAETILTRDALERTVAAARAAGRVALRPVASGADPLRSTLVGMAVSHGAGSGSYLPLAHAYLGAPSQIDRETVLEILGPLLADETVVKVGHDVKRNDHVLSRYGLPVDRWSTDLAVAAFLLDSDRRRFDLESLVREYLREGATGSEDDSGVPEQAEVDRMARHAGHEAERLFRLAPLLESRLENEGLGDLYRQIDGPLLPVLREMEAHGIRVDVEVLAVMSREMEEALSLARGEIHRLAGEEFNVDSPKQLREILFEKLALKPRRRTAKSGVHSTDAATLEALAGEHEIAARILRYRELAKLKGTYVDSLPQLVNAETGRVHTSFHPTGAATGRLSSSDPNLQNIPVRSEVGKKIRSAFIPDPGHVFLAADYSQVELRILAHLCDDPELVAAFRAGEDIHRHTAAKILGVVPTLVTEPMRRRAKAVNFGILYGMSETRLAREQGIPRAEARRFIAAYFERFRRVREYIDRVRDDARATGAVRTLFGRVRRFDALRRQAGRAEVEQALRAAVNTTIQGTAADLMKLAMLRVREALSRGGFASRLLLQVHDELLLEVPESEAAALGPLVKDAMEDVYPLSVPLVVDQKVGASWMEVT